MFQHTKTCPWARSLWKLPLTCTTTALIGMVCVNLVGAGVMSTMLSLVLAIVMLKNINLHVTPALAVALIPQIMESSEWSYPVAVGVGTSLLVVYFAGWQRFAGVNFR